MNYLICTECERKYDLNDPVWKCECGGLLDIEWKRFFDPAELGGRGHTIWRYREALPLLNNANIVTLGEGFSPVVKLRISGREVMMKSEHLFPSGSFKDRGTSVMISKIKELGIDSIAEDSSGNAGCSVSAYCTAAGIDCDIYVPASASPGKLEQIELYGAHLNKVSGSREDTAEAALKAAENVYYASHAYNPYFFHGTKTFAFEISEQLGWKVPDAVIVPVGNGSLILGAYMGFRDLAEAGLTERIPKLIGVQAENCAPLAAEFHSSEMGGVKSTIAEGISVVKPVRGSEIIKAIRKTGGDFITVSESEIKDALIKAIGMGHLIEPTSAAGFAGLIKYLGITETDELVLGAFTGSGLKSTVKIKQILAT